MIYIQMPDGQIIKKSDKANIQMAKDIINLICVFYGISFEDIIRRSRKRKFLQARQIAMLMIREHTGITLKATAEFFPFAKDHTTAHHSIKTITGLMKYDTLLANHVSAIDLLIKNHLK